MRLGRLVTVGVVALAPALVAAVPASAAPGLPVGPGSAAQCKAAGGAVVEPESLDHLQEQQGIDDQIDIGSCVGGGHDGTPILDPAAGVR